MMGNEWQRLDGTGPIRGRRLLSGGYDGDASLTHTGSLKGWLTVVR